MLVSVLECAKKRENERVKNKKREREGESEKVDDDNYLL